MSTDEQLTILSNDARATREAVIRMEGKLDLIMNKTEDHGRAIEDHETRLRELEKSRWPVAQIGMVVAVLSLVAAVLIPFFVR